METKHGMSYLEMKYNLMLAYCNLLSFYILLKLEGKKVEDHPVVKRLVHVKLMLEKLRPLDQKLAYQVEKMVRTATLGQVEQAAQGEEERLRYKPNIQMLQESKDDAQESEGADEEGEQEVSESEIEEDEATKKLVGKKRVRDSSSSDEEVREKVKKSGIYKASKLNPIQYQDI